MEALHQPHRVDETGSLAIIARLLRFRTARAIAGRALLGFRVHSFPALFQVDGTASANFLTEELCPVWDTGDALVLKIDDALVNLDDLVAVL